MKLFLIAFLFPFFVLAYPTTPNPETSPGDLCTETNPDFSAYRYSEKISYCTRNVSTQFKKSIYKNYDIPPEEQKDYTIDHIIPLAIGGSNSLENLWPEHIKVKATRPDLERKLYEQLNNDEITQKEAIKIILDAKFNCCSEQ